MKLHTKIYHDFFRIVPGEFVACEICGAPASDIHHIACKGIGGSKNKDYIENIMALCRSCHDKYGDREQYMQMLKDIHKEKILAK
ncbi:MAG: HNH endonuclease [Bacteroidales bacterium]